MKEPFIIIPKSLWADERFTAIERMIIAYRIGFADDYKVKNTTVAEAFGVSKRKVEQAFHKAIEHGLIQPEQMLMDTIIQESGSFSANKCSQGANGYSQGANKCSHSSEQMFAKQRTDVRYNNPDLPMKTEVLYNSNSIDNNIKNNIENNIEKTGEAKLDIIIQGSVMKLPSYHRKKEDYKHMLDPECLYVYSKGWYLGLSRADYDKAKKSLAQKKNNN